MIAADVIVMATPVYFYTMDAQMKTLIDRCVARYTEISNKAFYFIATAADGESGRWRGPSKGSAGSCTVWKARGKRASFTDRAHGKRRHQGKPRL